MHKLLYVSVDMALFMAISLPSNSKCNYKATYLYKYFQNNVFGEIAFGVSIIIIVLRLLLGINFFGCFTKILMVLSSIQGAPQSVYQAEKTDRHLRQCSIKIIDTPTKICSQVKSSKLFCNTDYILRKIP